MFDLIVLLFDICTLKKAPQDIPYSTHLLKLFVIGNFVINSLLTSITDKWFIALLKAIIVIMTISAFSALSLIIVKKSTRFCQTTCALLGTDALISLLSVPAIAAISLNQGGIAGFLLMNGLMIWYWVITGHIIRNALEQSFSFSLGLAFLYLFSSYQVTSLLDTLVK